MNEQRFQRGGLVDDKQREAEARKVVAELADQMKIAQKALDKLNELLIDETERELKKIHAEEQES